MALHTKCGICLRALIALLVGLAPTIATAASVTDVTLSPDPPVEYASFSLLIDLSYNSSCERYDRASPPTTLPGSVTVDVWFGAPGMCRVQPPSFIQIEVPVGPLHQGVYTLTVNAIVCGVGGCSGKPYVYPDYFTVVPEPPSVEMLDGRLVTAGSPVLQNASGTVQLEQGRLDAVGRRVFVVPEPRALWQLSTGSGLLVLLARCHSRSSRRRMP